MHVFELYRRVGYIKFLEESVKNFYKLQFFKGGWVIVIGWLFHIVLIFWRYASINWQIDKLVNMASILSLPKAVINHNYEFFQIFISSWNLFRKYSFKKNNILFSNRKLVWNIFTKNLGCNDRKIMRDMCW